MLKLQIDARRLAARAASDIEAIISTMVTEHFQTTIRAFQRRTPFRPYVVELVSGDRVRVDHPEALVVRGGVAVFVSASGVPVIFDHEGVSQILGDAEASSAA